MVDSRNDQQNAGQSQPRQAQQSQGNQSQGGGFQSQAGQSQGQPRGQQGGGQASGQPQQFDSSGGGQQSGGGGDTRFADQIRPHQEVTDQSGAVIGTVDHVDGDRIKLTRSSSSSGHHEYVPLSQVAGIEGNRVRLHDRGDASFGLSGD
jgi:hypothetical protein